jgi:hypothetical protein
MAHEDENNTGVAGDDLTTLDLWTVERRRTDTVTRVMTQLTLIKLIEKRAELYQSCVNAFVHPGELDERETQDLAAKALAIDDVLADPSLFSTLIACEA